MLDPRLNERDHIIKYIGIEVVQNLKEIAEGGRICMVVTFSDDKLSK